MNQVTKLPPISKEREKELAKMAREGNLEAKNELILSNMRFAVKVALEYRGRGLELDDLVGEATIALVEAAGAFDPARDVKLITFAQYRIKAAIMNALARVHIHIDEVEFRNFTASLHRVDDRVRWLHTTRIMRNLPEPDSTYIIKRFGLEGYSPHTLSDLAHERGSSVESTRQYEKKLLARIAKEIKEAEE